MPIGKNCIAKVPSKIAFLLNIENWKLYTGHSFRRTGATFLADAGADRGILKRAGRWESDSFAEGYVTESIYSKVAISNLNYEGSSKFIHQSIKSESVSIENHVFAENSGKVHVMNFSTGFLNKKSCS